VTLARQNGLDWTDLPPVPEGFEWEVILSKHYVTVQLRKHGLSGGFGRVMGETSMYRWQARRDGLKDSVVRLAQSVWKKYAYGTDDEEGLDKDLEELRRLGIKTRVERCQ